MTTIFDLPSDLAKEIISRIPLKSLKALRLTCKRLNNLCKSRRFLKVHLPKRAANKEEESRMIVMMDCNFKSLYLLRIVYVNENLSRETLGKLTCLNDSEQAKISQAFYSEGLLLCILKDDIVVWNPYSGQTRWIKPKYTHKEEQRYALGYVKNKSRRTHKILSFLGGYEIYDFESDTWKSIDVAPHWKLSIYQPEGRSLKGNTYWCATKGDSQVGDKLDDHIICFDFTSERFGPLMALPFSAGQHDYVALSCVREEKLAVILTHNEINPCKAEVWITTKIEAENVSWCKFLTMNTKPLDSIFFKCYFIDEEKEVVTGFNDSSHETLSIVGEAGYLRRLDLREPAEEKYLRKCVCSYVLSSLQIKQSKKNKRFSRVLQLKEQKESLTR